MAGEIPSDEVASTDSSYAFRDINPAMPTHVLVVPREHITSADTVEAGHGDILADMMLDRPAGGHGPKGWPSGATGSCSTSATTPRTRSATSTCTSSAAAGWSGHRGDVHGATRLPVALGPTPVSPTQVKILVPGNHLMVELLGHRDELLRLVEEAFGDTEILVRGNEISISGEEADRVGRLFDELVVLLRPGPAPRRRRRGSHHRDGEGRREARPRSWPPRCCARRGAARSGPRPAARRRYADAIAANVVTFAIGPAGTGKSYLAVALAVQALQGRQVSRIILTRPAVEAGERLGFLPGDMLAKVDPYLRPLYDALYDMLGPEGAKRLLDGDTIEVAPLAYMRGRTLNDSFLILDEAQNTTPEQMKMFLTRIGFGSKAVVTGDVTQVDLAAGRSGLVGLEAVLSGIDGLAFVHLTSRDVVRHRIVQDIVDAYERVPTAPPMTPTRLSDQTPDDASRSSPPTSRRPSRSTPCGWVRAGRGRPGRPGRAGRRRAVGAVRRRDRPWPSSTSASSAGRGPPTCSPSPSTRTT